MGTDSLDAIVIGSGISGGWAAKELCERGLKTLVLERGADIEPQPDRSHTGQFQEQGTRVRRFSIWHSPPGPLHSPQINLGMAIYDMEFIWMTE